MLHTDIPTSSDIAQLMSARAAASVSIYLETSPIPDRSETARLSFKDAVKSALLQIRQGGEDRETRLNADAVEQFAQDLLDDSRFWVFLSNSLAVFITSQGIKTFRLPNNLNPSVEVADRFNVKPLLRALTFAQTAFVLALSQNGVRLIEVTADLPAHTLTVPGLPDDAVDAVNVPSISGRSQHNRIQGSEGQKVRLHQYARAVDQALRGILLGHDRPLVLVAHEPIASIFRGVNSYGNLLPQGIGDNPETTSDAELAQLARPILDEYYAAALQRVTERYEDLVSAGRAQKDLSEIARSATFGAVETLLINIDKSTPGTVDDETGAIVFADKDDSVNYPIVDEIARRVFQQGGTVLAVRGEDLPGAAQEAAAILRFAQAK